GRAWWAAGRRGRRSRPSGGAWELRAIESAAASRRRRQWCPPPRSAPIGRAPATNRRGAAGVNGSRPCAGPISIACCEGVPPLAPPGRHRAHARGALCSFAAPSSPPAGPAAEAKERGLRGSYLAVQGDPLPVISALTRVHSPSKTGVNALKDALWRGGEEKARPMSTKRIFYLTTIRSDARTIPASLI